MNAAELPLWAAIVVAALALSGAMLTLLGVVGLVRFSSFYERVHAPTLGATLGTTLVVTASAVFFSVSEGRLIPRDLLIGAFLMLTTPITLIVLARAAAYRDRAEGVEDAPREP